MHTDRAAIFRISYPTLKKFKSHPKLLRVLEEYYGTCTRLALCDTLFMGLGIGPAPY
jgi:hypothetical protein